MAMGLGELVENIFSEGINEVIASTHLNAAPMGIIRKGENLSVIIYKTSHTADNVLRDGWIVAHITRDPILFVKTAFEDINEDLFIKDEIDRFLIWRIKGIENWIVFRAEAKNITQEKIFFSLEIIKSELSNVLPLPFHRGLSNLIEATIHGTRYILTKDSTLAFLIKHHGELVLRCGGPLEKEALKLLYSYLNKDLSKPVFTL
jgi:uncharacterized protein